MESFCKILRHERLLQWIRLLMEREPEPFQTITCHKGSQQRRALVCYFFVKGSFAYHDLSASVTKPYSGTCLLRPQEPVVEPKKRNLFSKLFRG